MKQILITLFLFTVFFNAQMVSAAVRCETQYGGGQSCQSFNELFVDKKVWNKDIAAYVDNLGLSDPLIGSGEEIIFQIIVKNTSNRKLDKIAVTDTLPQNLTLTSGSLNYDILNLEVGKSDIRTIKARLIRLSNNPCDKNSVTARFLDETDSDTAQYCQRTPPLQTALPPTGPENWTLLFLGTITSGITGLYLLKRKNKIWKEVELNGR